MHARPQVRAGAPGPSGAVLHLLKCSVLFLAVDLGSLVGRQMIHALAASAVGIQTTLYHYFLLFDRPAAGAFEYVIVNGAASAFSLVVALLGGWVSGRARSAGVRLFALYLASAGAIGLLSDSLAIVIQGDWLDLAASVGVPAVLLQTSAIATGAVLAVLIWMAGAGLQPPAIAIVVPWAAALALMPVVFVPVPWPFVFMMWAGQAPWLLVIASAVFHRRWRHAADLAEPSDLRLAMSVWVLPIFLASVVRLMVTGIRFGD